MPGPFAVLEDAVRSTVVSYAPGSGSLTVASAAGFPVPTPVAPILITAVVAATYGIYPESYATFEVTGVAGNTFTGLTLVSGADRAFQSGDIVEMRTVAKHLNDLAQPFGASGNGHGAGLVPDPGAVAEVTRYLREDATWVVPAGGGGGSPPGGTMGDIQVNAGGGSFGGVPVVPVAQLPVMVASGPAHAPGIVPDTPATASTTRYLREDGSWIVPPGTPTLPGGTNGQIQFRSGVNFGGFTPSGDGSLDPIDGMIVTATQGVPFAPSATVDTTNASNITSGVMAVAQLPALGASGAGHRAGLAPDPGATAGVTRYLREDATWVTPAGGGGGSPPGGTTGQLQINAGGGSFGGVTLSGDLSVNTATGQTFVVATLGAAFVASATTDTTNAANISSGTLPVGRLPALTGDVQMTAGNSAVQVNATRGYPFANSAIIDTTDATNINQGVMAVARLPALGASGAAHGPGLAPDPGATAGTTRFLCEDASWVVPAGVPTVPGGTPLQIQYHTTGGGFGGFTVAGDGTLSVFNGLLLVTATNGVPFAPSATTDTTNAANIASGVMAVARLPMMGASGAAHAAGLVPDPGSTAGAGRYLREDATWVAPPGGGGGSPPGGAVGQFQVNLGGGSFGGVTVSGDLTISSTGVGAVTRTGGTLFAPSATVDTTNAANISSGTLPSSRLPYPGTGTLGGVEGGGFVANQWLTGISGMGVPMSSQPAFSNLSGVAAVAQLPAMGASGPTTHAPGIVPDTPLIANTTRFLREDATWVVPPGTTVPGSPNGSIQFASGGGFAGFVMSGDATVNVVTGVITVTRTNNVVFAPSATTDTTNAANISSGTLPASRLPAPGIGVLGGVQAINAIANQWVANINTAGLPVLSQPAFSNIAGVAAVAQLPVMGASGTGHAPGIAPDPGATAGTTRYLREDSSWVAPTAVVPGGTNGQIQFNNGGAFGGFSMSGDVGVNTSSGRAVVSALNGVAFAPSATTDTTNAANISSGTLPASRLPAPGIGVLGGVQAVAAVANQWVANVNTAGLPVLSQPAFASLSGSATLAQLPAIGALTGLVNATGATAVPAAVSLSAWSDAAIGSVRGSVAYRGAAGWVGAVLALTPTAIQTAQYVAVPGDLVQCDTTAASFTVFLPTAPADKTRVMVEMIAGTYGVNVAATGSDVIRWTGGQAYIILEYINQSVTLQYQAAGAVWHVVGSNSDTRDTGDYLAASVPATNVSLTANVNTVVTGLSLPFGNWDISGLAYFQTTGATFPGANAFQFGPSPLNNGWPGGFDGVSNYPYVGTNITANMNLTFTNVAAMLTTTTTYYLVVRSAFTAGTVTAGGFIRARRWR